MVTTPYDGNPQSYDSMPTHGVCLKCMQGFQNNASVNCPNCGANLQSMNMYDAWAFDA